MIVQEVAVHGARFRGNQQAPILFRPRRRHLGHLEARELRPQRAEHLPRLAHRLLHLAVHVIEKNRLAECNAQSFHAVLQAAQRIVWNHARRGPVLRVRSLHRLVDQRRILDRSRDRPHAVERRTQRINAGTAYAPDRRLQAYDSA